MSANQKQEQEQDCKQSIDIELLKRQFEEVMNQIPPIKSQTIQAKVLNKIQSFISEVKGDIYWEDFSDEIDIDGLSVRVHRISFMNGSVEAVATFTTDYETWQCECSPTLFDVIQSGDVDLIREAISMYV